MMGRMSGATASYRFRAAQRIKSPAEFEAVYGAKAVKRAGPLRVHARPSEGGHHRLGLSIGVRVGNAVVRARVKRMLRETFRLWQHEWAGAYDLVVVAQAHDAASLEEYRRWMSDAAEQLHKHWVKRGG